MASDDSLLLTVECFNENDIIQQNVDIMFSVEFYNLDG